MLDLLNSKFIDFCNKNHIFKNIFIFLCGVIFVLQADFLQAESYKWVQPTVTISPTTEKKGRGGTIGTFLLADGVAATQQTSVAFKYDNDFLYAKIIVKEVDINALRLRHARFSPDRLCLTDSITFYFKNESQITKITITSNGRLEVSTTQKNNETLLENTKAKWRSNVSSGNWRGTLKIPLALIRDTEEKVESIEFAVIRREYPYREISAWPSATTDRDSPASWGKMIFGKRHPYMHTVNFSKPGLGPSKIRFLIYPEIYTVQLLVSEGSGKIQVLPSRLSREWGASGWQMYNYEVPPVGEVKFQSIVRFGRKIFWASPVLSIFSPDWFAKIKMTGLELERLKNKFQKLPSELQLKETRFLEIINKLFAQLETLQAELQLAKTQPLSQERTEKLNRLIETYKKLSARKSLLEGRLLAVCNSRDTEHFALGIAQSMNKLKRSQVNLDYSNPIRLRAARRERQSAQLVVIPFDVPLENVRVRWSDLSTSDGKKLGRDNVKVDIVGYVKTTKPSYEVEYVGWWPDPLLPLKPFDVPIYNTQPLWITVNVPAGTQAGTYHGSVEVDAGKGGKLSTPIELEVLGYDLPLKGKLRTKFGFSWNGELVKWYRWGKGESRPKIKYNNIPQDRARQIWDLSLGYRIYASGTYEFLPFPRIEDIDYCIERGLNNYQVGNGSSTDFFPRLEKTCNELRKRGLMDMAFVYGYDEYAEENPRDRASMIKNWTLLKKQIPDLARANVYGKPTQEVMNVLDIVMPLTAELDHHKRWEHWRKAGHKVGAYMCNGPQHPYANFFIDYPAIDHRIVFWQLYANRVDFFFYYLSNRWKHSDRSSGPRWPDAPWVTASHGDDNGDGQLFYPGKKAVLGSVRLENIRDGIEDYEALAVLEELTSKLCPQKHSEQIRKNREMLRVPPEITTSLSKYTKSTKQLLEVRQKLDGLILETIKILKVSQPVK